MKSFANWMTVIFMIMFWGFRIMVAYMHAKGKAFVATPLDPTTEIILLFVTLLCIILVAKRVIWGGFIYVISYLGYFGVDLFNKLMPTIKGQSIGISTGFDMFISTIAIILSLVVMIDLASDHMKKPDDKKTDWFYNNKDLDRQVDEREDHNNYKLY